MSHVRTAFYSLIFATTAGIVACGGAAPSDDDDAVPTKDEKLVCPIINPPPQCIPKVCYPPSYLVNGKCYTPPPPKCPAVGGVDEVSSGGTCVPCGQANDPICTSTTTAGYTSACTQVGTMPSGGTCVTCGGNNEPACSSANCTQSGTVDLNGNCELCGALNEPVCNATSTPNFSATAACTAAGTVAANGICVACGRMGQPVCNPTSNPPGVFQAACTQFDTGPAADGTCEQACVFDPSCPPGMYNKTAPLMGTPPNSAFACNTTLAAAPGSAQCTLGGYGQDPPTPASFAPSSATPGAPIEPVGCTFTPPSVASCVTTLDPTGKTNLAKYVPPFAAPVATSVVVGGSAVYAIASPPPGQAGEAIGGPNAVFAWGDNTYYQLGNGTNQYSSTPQVPIYYPPVPAAADPAAVGYGALTVQSLVAGDEDACALLSDGSVHCWGTVASYPSPVVWKTDTQIQFPADTATSAAAPPIVQITHGAHHACALTAPPAGATSGNVYCWGNNDYLQLGMPASLVNSPSTSPNALTVWEVPLAANFKGTAGSGPGTVQSVVASGNTTCVLANVFGQSAHAVYCWGDNTEGSTGANQGDDGNLWSSLQNTEVALAGDGDPTTLIGSSLGAEGQYGSFCAYTGALTGWFCWGANDQGQLDIPTPQMPGGAFGFKVPVALPSSIATASSLVLGASHSCAEVVAGSVTSTYCFGGDGDGQLGFLASTAEVTATSVPAPPSSIAFPGSTYSSPVGSPLAVGNDLTCGIYVASEPTYTPANPPALAASGTAGSYGTPNATGNLACWGGGSSNLVSSPVPSLLKW